MKHQHNEDQDDHKLVGGYAKKSKRKSPRKSKRKSKRVSKRRSPRKSSRRKLKRVSCKETGHLKTPVKGRQCRRRRSCKNGRLKRHVGRRQCRKSKRKSRRKSSNQEMVLYGGASCGSYKKKKQVGGA